MTTLISSLTARLALSLTLGASLLSPAFAEKADRMKVMEVESELPGKVDLQKRQVVFNGNVVISKGSMSIHANRIEVRESSDGFQHAVAIGSATAPARFRQKREGLNEFIEGEAERLEYDSGTDTIRFVEKALVRRLRGTETAEEVTGALIVYDNRAEMFTVSGGAAAATPANPTGKVKVKLVPSAASAASAASGPSAGERP